MPRSRVRTGAEELRAIVNILDSQNEGWNDLWTAEQLVKLGRAALACDWEYPMTRWSQRQIREALRGISPRFDDAGQPVHND